MLAEGFAQAVRRLTTKLPNLTNLHLYSTTISHDFCLVHRDRESNTAEDSINAPLARVPEARKTVVVALLTEVRG